MLKQIRHSREDKLALSANIAATLAARFGKRIRFNEPMAAHTTLRVGGPADALVMPRSPEELIDLMRLLHDEGIAWFILGGGTNLLVRDQGIRGVVISLSRMCRIRRVAEGPESTRVTVEAGARLSALCRYAQENGLSGMSFAVGIPGTVGGAAMMNAGTVLGDMGTVITDLAVLHPPDRVETIGRDRLDFTYRELKWDRSGMPPVILSAAIRLGRTAPDDLRQSTNERTAWRKASQPGGFSAGCVFRNPCQGPSAGELIDRSGLKGYAEGDALISEKHANFFINRGNATAADLLRLMGVVQERVFNTFNTLLEPEIKIVGQA